MTDQQGTGLTDKQSTELRVEGVPQDALRRLAELRPGRPGGIFTSDLSVNEFLLVREAGFRPLGLVLGSSIYHVGLQVGRWGKNQELDVLSQAMYHARELAMTRMEAEADALGADGIVGVRLDVEMKEFGNDIAEFIAVGTAVKAEPGAGGGGVSDWRNNKRQPFTSDLSGQDFWTLIRAGYAPLGMTMGSCVYHIAHQRIGGKIGNIGRNVELEQFTQALYDARELAMSRMQAEAEELHAEGIVGRAAAPAQPHLGLAHHGVLRHRHGRPAAARGSRHRAAHHGPQPRRLTARRPGQGRKAARGPRRGRSRPGRGTRSCPARAVRGRRSPARRGRRWRTPTLPRSGARPPRPARGTDGAPARVSTFTGRSTELTTARMSARLVSPGAYSTSAPASWYACRRRMVSARSGRPCR